MEIKTKRMETDADTNFFIEVVKNTIIQSADYKSIDYLFDSAVKLQKKQTCDGYEHWIEKPVEFLLKEIIKNEHFSPVLTLYSINKFITLFSKEECQDVVDCVVAEYTLREHLCKLSEKLCDVDLDWYKINKVVDDVTDEKCKKPNLKFLNALKFESVVVLNAIKHSSSLTTADILLSEVITCLDSQEDLKLWYILMRKENLEILLNLCVKYNKLLVSLMKCFDKFADEIESNYDEELNVKYSHVNLDFEDFVQVFQSFYNEKDLRKPMNEFLDKRMDIENKNFNFWLDVKACLCLPY